jgi:hypothetical protein
MIIKYKFDKDILDKLQIPNQIYTHFTLKKIIKNKFKVVIKNNNSYIILSDDLKKIFNLDNFLINIDNLILILKTNYTDDLNKPNYYYYSYNKNPNYNIIE